MSEQDDADVIEQAPRQSAFFTSVRLLALRGVIGSVIGGGSRRIAVIAAACALLATAATVATLRLTEGPGTDRGLAGLVAEVTTVPVGKSVPGLSALPPPSSSDGAFSSTLMISPDTVTLVISPPLTRGGKPEVLYVGTGYCPYCAMENWPLIVALSRFGQFSGLATSRSPRFENVAPIDSWTFYRSRYTSRYLSFVPVERYSNVLVSPKANPNVAKSYRVLQRLTPAQRAIFDKFETSRSTPFLDFGNRAVQIGSGTMSPRLMAGKSWRQIAAALRQPKTELGQALLDEADVLTAELCSLTGNRPAAACPAFLQKAEHPQ